MNFKVKSIIVALVLSLSGISAQALVVKFSEPSDKKIADLTLSNKATLEQDGAQNKPVDLNRVAEGIREKSLLGIKVYVAQIFASAKPDKSSGAAAIDSLLKNKPVVMALTFVRNVEGKQIVDAYKESLAANGIKSDEEPFRNFLEEVQKRAQTQKGTTLWFVLEGKEQISFYTEGKESITIAGAANSNFQKNFLSIWLGKTTDSKLENLKNQLLK